LIPSAEDIKRQVIPRWRTVRATTEAGEQVSVHPQRSTELEKSLTDRMAQEFEQRLKEWQQEKDISTAEELLAAAIVMGTVVDDVRAAARLVADDDHSLRGSKDIARSILGILNPEVHEPLSDETTKMRLEIARRKRLLRMYPRDALLLTETALQYTNLGMNNPAASLLKSAAAVAPNNRYVLRSLTRFWVHWGEPDKALHFLSKSEATRHDPWLMAAQMAAEDVARKPPSFWREARQLLGADRFSDFELAELAAAAGTLQLEAGSHKIARKLFRRSLTAPTENAVAQAHWASRRDPAIDASRAVTPDAFEALTWENIVTGRSSEAVSAAVQWQRIEPFSLRPAGTGSFIAVSHLGDGKLGEMFCRRGLIANRGSSALHNNLAVALAIQGRIEEAKKELGNIKSHLSITERVVNFATQGLIQMRSGNVSEGGRLYQKAIGVAIENKSRLLWCRAAANYALEYARYDNSDLPETVALIEKVFDDLDDKTKSMASDVPAVLERAKKIRSASEIIEAVGNVRSNLISYPADNEVLG
jgi:tetratricopeptide (TPR) repeat protein